MNEALLRAAAVVVAFAIDRLLGEPPLRWHPVVWMGKALGATGAPWPHRPPLQQFVGGALAWMFVGGVVSAVAVLAVILIHRMPQSDPWEVLVQGLILGILLKPLLAWRLLRDEVTGVECALTTGLEAGRRRLSRLVSRDTRALGANEVRQSAIESLAENLNDSWVAPLFWFSLGGLPAAALYRFANTADAMWGYRGRWEWAGKWAARADDLLSYLPARLTALLLAFAGRCSPAGLKRVAGLTPSPNSGWPMGMLALALGVRLGKPGVYVLNAGGMEPSAVHTVRAIAICAGAARLAVAISAAMLVLVGLSPW